MVTLTIDPKLFTSPQEAYWYLKERRAISELVKALRRAGVAESLRYFYVVEWQMKGHDGGPPSEMPHFHVLLEAPYVDFKLLARLWGRNRPESAAPWEGTYEGDLKDTVPEFGTVRLSKRPIKSALHAARYATKYLTKYPAEGFPEWVLTSNRQLRRYETSRGFWGNSRSRAKVGGNESIIDPTDVESHHVDCCCKGCREVKKPTFPPRRRRSLAERINICGEPAAILKAKEFIQPDGEVLPGRPQFVEPCVLSFKQAMRKFSVADVGQRRFEITEEQVAVLHTLREAASTDRPKSNRRRRRKAA